MPHDLPHGDRPTSDPRDHPGRRHAGPHHDPHPGFPVDPDVTSTDVPLLPQRIPVLVWTRRRALVAVALGGALGSLARWSVAEALPQHAGAFPWGTFVANVTGCFAIGVLMVLVVERWPHRPLARLFLGTGFLGGYTTFSTYAVDVRGLVASGHSAVAGAYLAATLVVGLLAVVTGLRLTERVLR